MRQRTLALLRALDPADMGKVWDVPGAPMPMSLRSWLWFVVEHEIHHKAQLSIYLRQRGSSQSKPVGQPHGSTGVEG